MAISRTYVDEILSAWPEKPRDVARTIVEKYGPPDEATIGFLVWRQNGPWKETIVYREEVPHEFPMPHADVLEQFIDYRLPVDKYRDIAAFDGSVIPERTKGVISARCDNEEANFLALNLANDIANGHATVDGARQTYAETIQALMEGQKRPYVQGLQFTVMGNTQDPDQATIKGKGMAQKATEAVKNAFTGESREP